MKKKIINAIIIILIIAMNFTQVITNSFIRRTVAISVNILAIVTFLIELKIIKDIEKIDKIMSIISIIIFAIYIMLLIVF